MMHSYFSYLENPSFESHRGWSCGFIGCLLLMLSWNHATAQSFDRFSNNAAATASETPTFDEGPPPPIGGAGSPAGGELAAAETVDPTLSADPNAASNAASGEQPSAEASGEADETASESGLSGSLPAMLDVISSAGVMAIPIAACSILLVMFALERAINLRRPRVIPKHFVKLFLSELEGGNLKPAEALELCEENGSPIADVFAAAVKKWNRPNVEVEQAVLDEGERVANGLRRYLRLFNGISTVSPLLGLLGTVLGMIEAFNAIAASDAMGKPEYLASGISKALLTTAGGLSVAIPAYIVYMYFTSRVDRLIIEVDSLGQKAVFAIGSDNWKQNSKSKKAA